MTDQVIQSNQSSVILRSLTDAETADMSYEIRTSYPILAKQYKEIQSVSAISGAPAGQEVSFNLNKSQLLSDILIKTAYTTTTTGMAATQYVGLNMFEKIEIRSNNKVIMTMSDAFILARTQEMDEARRNAIYRRALPLVPTTEVVGTTGTVSCVTYTPLFCTFFDSVKANFDLNFYEQIQIVCKFNTAARAGFNIPLDTATCTLWSWTHVLDDKAYAMLRAKNQVPGAPMNMLMYNTFTESQECTSTTANTMRLNVNYPVVKTYISIRAKTTALLGAQFRIDNFTLRVGGTALVESVPSLVGNWESESKGASRLTCNAATTFSRTDNDAICINWGLDTRNLSYNSGACSFNQINYPLIELNHQTLTTAASYQIYVVHLYWQLLTLDANNGTVVVSANS